MGLKVFQKLQLIAFDREQVVGVFVFDQVAGGVTLGMHREARCGTRASGRIRIDCCWQSNVTAALDRSRPVNPAIACRAGQCRCLPEQQRQPLPSPLGDLTQGTASGAVEAQVMVCAQQRIKALLLARDDRPHANV